MLELKNVKKRIKNKEILSEIDYKFEKGIYGILGPNGAGKTTLLRCITQLYPLSSGEITYFDDNIIMNKEYRQNVGYLPQKFGLLRELTVYDMMSAMALMKEVEKEKVDEEVRRCVELVNLTDKMNDKVKTLSGGMIRRLGIAQAVLNSPKIIILDEPTAGLDPEERIRFKNIVLKLKEKHTVIISTHIVEDVEALCDYILIMNNGKIVKSGSCAYIQSCASGKVYELAEEDREVLIEPYCVQHYVDRNGRKMLQVLSNVKQESEKVYHINSSVEDGYVCILKNI